MSRGSWIDVTERLPVDDVPVLVTFIDEDSEQLDAWIAYVESAKGVIRWSSAEGWPLNVTHWQPIPAPPSPVPCGLPGCGGYACADLGSSCSPTSRPDSNP